MFDESNKVDEVVYNPRSACGELEFSVVTASPHTSDGMSSLAVTTIGKMGDSGARGVYAFEQDDDDLEALEVWADREYALATRLWEVVRNAWRDGRCETAAEHDKDGVLRAGTYYLTEPEAWEVRDAYDANPDNIQLLARPSSLLTLLDQII